MDQTDWVAGLIDKVYSGYLDYTKAHGVYEAYNDEDFRCPILDSFDNVQYINIQHKLIVLRFYSPVNPMGSCRARSVYLTTHLLGRFSPLCG